MAFKNGSLISPEGRRKKEGKRKGEKKHGKAQERHVIVHFARGVFNYWTAEWVRFSQLTWDVHLQQEGQGRERDGGMEWRQRRMGRVLIKMWGGWSCLFWLLRAVKLGFSQSHGPGNRKATTVCCFGAVVTPRNYWRWEEAHHPVFALE